MRRTLKIAAIEAKVHTRSLGFWALFLLWQGAVAFHFVDNAEFAPGTQVWGALSNFTPLLLTLAVLYFASVLGREETVGLSELIDALPHRTEEMVWGKLLGTYCLWALFGAELVAIYLVKGHYAGVPWVTLVGRAVTLSVVYLSSLATAAGVGFGVASAVRGARSVYATGLLAWLGGVTFLPLLALEFVHPVRARWLIMFSPAGFTDYAWSELWALGPGTDLAWRQNLWFAGLGLALVALTGVGYKIWRDRSPGRALSAVALLAGVVVAMGAATGYHEVYAARISSHDHQVRTYHGDELRQASGPAPIEVTAYDLRLVFEREHRLEARAVLTVRNRGLHSLSVIPLTLNAGFTVDSVSLAGQADSQGSSRSGTVPAGGEARAEVLATTRDGSFLTVILNRPLAPGAETSLALAYQGTIWDFTSGRGSGPSLVAGVDENLIWLPAGYAWYPAPGHQLLARLWPIATRATGQEWEVRYQPVLFDPAEYSLSLAGAPGLSLATPFGEASASGVRTGEDPGNSGQPVRVAAGRTYTGAGVFVIGAPEFRVVRGALGPAMAAPGADQIALSFSSSLAAAVTLCRQLLPTPVPPELSVLALPSAAGAAGRPQPGEALTADEDMMAMLVRLGQASYIRMWPLFESGENALLDLWLRPAAEGTAGPMPPGLQVRRAFREFLVAVIKGEPQGQKVYAANIDWALANASLYVTGEAGPVTGEAGPFTETLRSLDTLYKERGLSAVKKLLGDVWPKMVAGDLSLQELKECLAESGLGRGGQGR